MINLHMTGAKELVQELRRLYRSNEPTFTGIALHVLKDEVLSKTAAGKDFTGENFTPYSPGYAKRKGQTNVDLRSKGSGPHMLDMLTVIRNGPGEALLTIRDKKKSEIASYHNQGTKHMPKREFLNVDERGVEKIAKTVENLLVKAYRGLIS